VQASVSGTSLAVRQATPRSPWTTGQTATADAVAAARLVEQLTATDLLAAHQLAAAVLSGCTPPLLPTALAWASQRRVRGLSAGVTAAWCWGEVLAHLAEIGTADERDSAIDLAIQPYHSIDFGALASGFRLTAART
jgi:hypothetical protein